MAGPASRVVFAIDSAGLSDEVAFVSDGQLSGLCLKGIMVAEVSPESAVGGPLSLVENGDTIRIDVDGAYSTSTCRMPNLESGGYAAASRCCRSQRAIYRSISARFNRCPPEPC